MSTKYTYLAGLVAAFLCFYLGWFVRGSELEHSARVLAIQSISASIEELSNKLPEQKVVEVEKTVFEKTPFCAFAEEERARKEVSLNGSGLDFCKQLMGVSGDNDSNLRVPDLYDAINQWMVSDSADTGLEDRIMSHVLLVLIDCFQKT